MNIFCRLGKHTNVVVVRNDIPGETKRYYPFCAGCRQYVGLPLAEKKYGRELWQVIKGLTE